MDVVAACEEEDIAEVEEDAAVPSVEEVTSV